MGKPFGVLDAPVNNQSVNGFAEVRGWELHDSIVQTVISISIDGNVTEGQAERIPRPDVAKDYAELATKNPFPGFSVTINTACFANGPHILACEASGGGVVTQIGRININIDNGPEQLVYKHAYWTVDALRRVRKLARLVSILECPSCATPLAFQSSAQLECKACGSHFQLKNHVPIMLTQEPEYPVDETLLDSPASNHPYPRPVLGFLEKLIAGGGLALEVGSGRRSFGFDPLIQVEICAYPFTDVVNQSERLPFRDESFDVVFALAVTEHVKRPWFLASEMQRVLKKGGAIYVDSAFLQPIHGYPSHFFNVTHYALRNIFNEVEVASLGPGPHQHPWFALSWILDHALADLPDAQKKLLSGMTMGDFVVELQRYCGGQPSKLREISLPQGRIEELAAGFTLIGQKICPPATR